MLNHYYRLIIISLFFLFQNIQIFKGDFELIIIKYETLGCRIDGYILFSLLSAMYQAFILQVIVTSRKSFGGSRK
jgi:hypothetical protein